MKKAAILTSLMFFALSAAAQSEESRWFGGKNNDDIELRARSQGEGMERVVTLTAIKNVPGSYTVVFEYLNDAPGTGIYRVIRDYSTEIETFKYGLPGFSIQSFNAPINEKKMNEKYTYRLPFAEGENKSVSISRYDTPAKSKIKDVNRCSFNFSADEGDDIYAMRKGVVTEIDDARWYIEGLLNNQVLRKANKSVCVEHGDGSLAIYHNVQDGTLTVKPGDMVYPDVVIGKAGTLNEETYDIRVSLYYYSCPMLRSIPNFRMLECRYLEPWFATPSGVVQLKDGDDAVCQAAEELIVAEMTKREKKERSKNK